MQGRVRERISSSGEELRRRRRRSPHRPGFFVVASSADSLDLVHALILAAARLGAGVGGVLRAGHKLRFRRARHGWTAALSSSGNRECIHCPAGPAERPQSGDRGRQRRAEVALVRSRPSTRSSLSG